MNEGCVVVSSAEDLSCKAREVAVRKQPIEIVSIFEVIGWVPRRWCAVAQNPKDRRGGEDNKDCGKQELVEVRSQFRGYHVTG